MSAYQRIRVILGTKRGKVVHLLVVAESIHAGISSHVNLFASPPLSMTTLGDQIQDVDDAQREVRARMPGAAAKRDLLRDGLWTSLEILRVYVQALCDESPEKSAILIEAAGMKIASSTTPVKPPLRVRQGRYSGIVIVEAYVALVAPGSAGRFFNWAYSLDGETWLSVPSTPGGSTVIAGLPRLTDVRFRMSVTTPDGTGPWSYEVTFLVH